MSFPGKEGIYVNGVWGDNIDIFWREKLTVNFSFGNRAKIIFDFLFNLFERHFLFSFFLFFWLKKTN